MSHGAVAAVRAVPAMPNGTASAAKGAAIALMTSRSLAPPPPTSSSRLYAVGSNACSFAMRSIHDTKETFLLVCISFLDALDSLQSKLHLPTSLVKELKRRLSKMVDRSLTRPVSATTHAKIQQAQSLGELIAESDTWGDVAKPEEIKGFVHWLLAVMKWVNELAVAGTIGVCRRVFILIMNFPGVPTACTLFCRIFDMVEHTLHLTRSLGGSSFCSSSIVAVDGSSSSSASSSSLLSHTTTASLRKSKRAKYDHYMDDSRLTAVVLEYREKECMVPVNINRRIQQFMHFEIPLRSFEATVRLPVDLHNTTYNGHLDDQDRGGDGGEGGGETALATTTSYSSSSSSSGPSSSSPRSIPASPRERRKFNLIYGNYFDDVLYQARDKLRLQRAVNLTGESHRQIPRFNRSECDQEVHLTCGRNCAVKEGPGMYRSVRGTVPILRNRYVYFEMKLTSDQLTTTSATTNSGSALVPVEEEKEISACIGIAPRSMLLNTLVGTAKHSVGLNAAGHVLVSGPQRRFIAVDRGFACPSTVGVLVYIRDDEQLDGLTDHKYQYHTADDASCRDTELAHADVQFSVNGRAMRDASGNIVVATIPFPSRTELYPTLSLHTQGLCVYAQFSSPDIAAFDPACFLLSREEAHEVVCLDGLQVPML